MSITIDRCNEIEREINDDKGVDIGFMCNNNDNFVDVIGYDCSKCKTQLQFDNRLQTIEKHNLVCPICGDKRKIVILNLNVV